MSKLHRPPNSSVNNLQCIMIYSLSQEETLRVRKGTDTESRIASDSSSKPNRKHKLDKKLVCIPYHIIIINVIVRGVGSKNRGGLLRTVKAASADDCAEACKLKMLVFSSYH